MLLHEWTSRTAGLPYTEAGREKSEWHQHHETRAGEYDGQDGAVRKQPGEPRHREDGGLFLWEEEDWGPVVRAAAQVSDTDLDWFIK